MTTVNNISGTIETGTFNTVDEDGFGLLVNPLEDVEKVDQNDFNLRDISARLHADVYLENGYITQDQITYAGYIDDDVDPYQEVSTYYFIDTQGVKATARQIPVMGKDISTLPTLRHFAVSPDILAYEAGVDSVVDIKPNEIVEISALASKNGSSDVAYSQRKQTTFGLYARMLRESVDEGHKLWVMSTDHRVTRIINGLLGGNLVSIGESQDYIGSVSDPSCVNPQKIIDYILLDPNANQVGRSMLIETLRGADRSQLTEAASSVLDEEYPGLLSQKSTIEKIVRHPEAVAALGLGAYAALRAVPLASVDQFNGSVAVFAAIDIGTVPPYVWGLKNMYTKANSTYRKTVASAVATASFIAPYAYMYEQGEDYPGAVNVIVGSFIVGGVAKEAISRKTFKSNNEYLKGAFAQNDI